MDKAAPQEIAHGFGEFEADGPNLIGREWPVGSGNLEKILAGSQVEYEHDFEGVAADFEELYDLRVIELRDDFGFMDKKIEIRSASRFRLEGPLDKYGLPIRTVDAPERLEPLAPFHREGIETAKQEIPRSGRMKSGFKKTLVKKNKSAKWAFSRSPFAGLVTIGTMRFHFSPK